MRGSEPEGKNDERARQRKEGREARASPEKGKNAATFCGCSRPDFESAKEEGDEASERKREQTGVERVAVRSSSRFRVLDLATRCRIGVTAVGIEGGSGED